MQFQQEDIQKLAHLSRLRLSEHDVEKFRDQLTSIVTYADQIMGIDVSQVRMEQSPEGALRSDISEPSNNAVDLLGAAPKTEEGHIATHQVK